MKQVSLTMVPMRNLSQQSINTRRPTTTQRHSTVQTIQPKQANHQTSHHNIVQKVTHQNNPHLKAQKKTIFRATSTEQPSQKKTFITTKYSSTESHTHRSSESNNKSN